MPFQNQKTTKDFYCSLWLYKKISSFLNTISKHYKWVMLLGPSFFNDRGHIKTLKRITRTVDFGIPTLEIFLNINRSWPTIGIIYIFVISTWTSSYYWYYKQFLGSMNKCSVPKKQQFICNRLIISKVSCFLLKASWWGCFKGVSLLSDICLAKNVDDILDDINGLVGIFLLPESDESSDDIFNKSSEDKDSDEIIIVFCAIWTRSYSLIASIQTRSYFLIESLWRNVFSIFSLASFIISITS